ncbi:MAG TPA: site-2 protease family protein [Bacteroidales bacterium]|nr:site-2 protease family protein [Bacteroidales bacterium]
MDFINIERTLKFLPGIILGLTVHEFCHAWMAHLSGDSTSKEQGRITLNPLKHIDPIGFIFLLVAGFGWAKPVQFNEEKLHKKIDVIKIALAGPLSNALLAMLLSILFVVIEKSYPENYSSGFQLMNEVFVYAIFINWGLFIFNLIPVPPLDGSHLLFYPLRRYPEVYNALYRYGSIAFFILLLISSTTKADLLPIGNVIKFFVEGFMSILGYRISL